MNKAEGIDALFTDKAYNVKRVLKDVGCVRKADNLAPDCLTVEELSERCDFPVIMWDGIKDRMIELGMSICYFTGRGHYMGRKGEQATNITHNWGQINGRARRIERQLRLMSKAGTLEEAEEFSRKILGKPLNKLPKVLKTLGAPLPPPLQNLLLSGGSTLNLGSK